MKQRIVVFALAVIGLLSSAAGVYAKNDTEFSIETVRAYDFLEALNIYESDRTDTNREITRSDLIEIIGHIISYETAVNEEGISDFFDDVSNPEISDIVDFLYQTGVVSGTGERIFEPDSPAKTEQLITYLVKLLGYDRYASASGGYPKGYMVCADALKLLKGSSAVINGNLREKDMAVIVSNALKVNTARDILEYSLEPSRSETLLTKWQDIYSGTGVVIDDGITSVTGASTIDVNMVKINDDVMNNGEYTPSDYIGQSVNYFYREEPLSVGTLVYIEAEDKRQQTVVIKADEIDATERYKIYYYPENKGSKSRYVRISPVATVIYNGKSYLQYTAEDLKINSGNITLIDTEDDGEYDIVYIKEYKSIIFDSYKEFDGKATLVDAYASYRNIEYNTEETSVRIVREGEVVTPDKLQKWDVLNIVASRPDESGRNLLDIDVTIEPVGGQITSVCDDEVEVSGIQYEISRDYLEVSKETKYAPELLSGRAGILLLDIDGKIGGFREISQYEYIYATKLMVDEEADPVVVTLRGYIWDKGFVDLQFAERVTINETRDKLPDVLRKDDNFVTAVETSDIGNKYIIKPQLLRIRLNGAGCIAKLETAVDMTDKTDIKARSQAEANDTFRKCTENDDLPYRGAGSFSGKVYPNSRTRVIVVPKDDASLTKIYESRDGMSFGYDQSYDIITYNESLYNVPEYIIVNKSGASGSEGDDDTLKKSSFYIHDNFKFILNEDEEAESALYGLQNGEKVTKSLVEDFTVINEPYSIGPDDLEFGTVVQVGEDAEGNVNFIRRWYTPSQGFVKSGTSDDYRQNWRSLISGQVKSVSSDGNYIIVDDGKQYTYDLGSATITICDLENKEVYPGQKTEISVDDQVAIRIRETRVHEVVVYKNLK
ncbi:MAG: hypothetical protein J6N52_10245 [Clostridia bacterium]|nr:hypothetical protein [Clostridia bacterium]